jgi:Ring finger domain
MSDVECDYIVCNFCGELVPTLNNHDACYGNRILSSDGGIEGSVTSHHQAIDLVEESEDQQQRGDVWSCPSCTFFNSFSNNDCEMCNHFQVNARNSDPVRTDPFNDFLETSDFEQLLRIFGDGTENMGADEMDIDVLPTQTIINVEKELPSKDLRQCVICLDDFKSGDQRKTLPCLHGYHKACIDRALRNRAYCPLCNSGLNS